MLNNQLNIKMDNRRFKDTDNFVQVTESTIKQIRKVHGDISHFIYRDVSDERNVYIIEPKFLSATPVPSSSLATLVVGPVKSTIESFIDVTTNTIASID